MAEAHHFGPLSANISTVPPAFSMSDFLSALELQHAFERVQAVKPDLASEVEFEMENVREVLRFYQFMVKDTKSQAHGVALSITAFTAFRMHCGGTPFEDMRYVENLLYDKNAGPLPMLQKIHLESLPEGMISQKVAESRSALAYLEGLVVSPGHGCRIFASFSASYQVIADCLCFLTCYLNSKDMGDGKLCF